MRRVRVSAPGKLMISGEYVVLDGAEALVAAVDARLFAVGASASRSPDPPGLPPEALLTRDRAEAELGAAVGMSLAVDASALRQGELKLGLGSSSAASVASAAAVVAWHGGDIAARRHDILRWALAGHRAVAPEGSGADVAASALGGVVRYRRDAPEAASAVAWPPGLGLEVVWTGAPARTSDLVAQVKALAATEPAAYGRAMGGLRAAADVLRDAVLAGDAAGAVEAAGAHGRAMGALGDAAGAPIVEARLARVAALAAEHGGASKPSGAGGGDVALAFFADLDARAAFIAACRREGLTLLTLHVGAEGVRLEDQE